MPKDEIGRDAITGRYIRKDHNTWTIDLDVDGKIWKSWSYGFKTKKRAIAHINEIGNAFENGIQIA